MKIWKTIVLSLLVASLVPVTVMAQTMTKASPEISKAAAVKTEAKTDSAAVKKGKKHHPKKVGKKRKTAVSTK